MGKKETRTSPLDADPHRIAIPHRRRRILVGAAAEDVRRPVEHRGSQGTAGLTRQCDRTPALPCPTYYPRDLVSLW